MPEVDCPSCGTTLEYKGKPGKKVRCPDCNTSFLPPAAAAPPLDLDALVAAARAKEAAERILAGTPAGERQCCQCKGTDDLTAYPYHASKDKEVDERHQGTYKMVYTTYHGLLNTSGWVCGKGVGNAVKLSGIVTLVVVGGIYVTLVGLGFYLWLTTATLSFLGGLGFMVINIVWCTVVVGGGGWAIYSNVQNPDGHGQEIALRYNRGRLRKVGYHHFGTDHLKTDTVDDMLRRNRAPGQN